MVVEWARNTISSVSLDAAGLIALAELTAIAKRTALQGTAFYTDVLILCPGIHRQQDATALSRGEYPITANMTSGYVFRVENEATVNYLQMVGKTGHLTTLNVSLDKARLRWLRPAVDLSGSFVSVLFYVLPALLTVAALFLLITIEDYWGLGVLAMLMVSRLLNVIGIRRRCDASWHGVREPGQKSDLLVLLSQDRWIRMHGLTDDLKMVTSGQWLRDATFFETSLAGCATVIVYLAAVLTSNASALGKIVFLVLLLVNVGLLALSNEFLSSLQMKGRLVKVIGEPKPYKRRLDLAEQLVEESGRSDWAFKMGMIADNVAEATENSKRPGLNAVEV